MAFGLYEENVQVDPEKEHIERTVLQEYKQKLDSREYNTRSNWPKIWLDKWKKWNEKMAKSVFFWH